MNDFCTLLGMIFRARKGCGTKVVNGELNSWSIQSKTGVRFDRLKCTSSEDAGTLFLVV